MPSRNNHAVIAAAGSRKTQYVIDCALGNSAERVLVTTYTTENLNQLTERIMQREHLIPPHITLMGWFSFLLNECARPYQGSVLGDVGIMRGLNFVGARSRYERRSNPKRYYLDTHRDAYRDELSALAVRANEASGGAVVDRLSKMFDRIYIDEVQDMSGYDLELIELLMQSPVAVTVVGDPRQAILSTNNSRKNTKYKGSRFVDWLTEREDLCHIEERAVSYRCNQAICDFADSLYPALPPTQSMNSETTGHDGVFTIKPSEVGAYVEQYAPVVLRYDKRADTQGLSAINIGVSKGSTYDRVLIFPTGPMKKYYKTRNPSDAGSREKFYVAVTRARHSVTFVMP